MMTIAAIAMGYTALGQAENAKVSAASAAPGADRGDENTAVSTFKFVCPFH